MLTVIYAECHNAECRHAECRYAECRYLECHYAECRYAECRYAECHYAECRYPECRGALDLFMLFCNIFWFKKRKDRIKKFCHGYIFKCSVHFIKLSRL
jgi:hypothetical protein